MTAPRILVVTGARALSRTCAARQWALRNLMQRMFSEALGAAVNVIAHGGCDDSPDEWADVLARETRLTRVRFSLQSLRRTQAREPWAEEWRDGAWHVRPIARVELYRYAAPLERNAAMARWAGDMLSQGHDVRGLALRCPWPMRDGERATQGTAHCRDRLIEALGAERVTDLECPREFGPMKESA